MWCIPELISSFISAYTSCHIKVQVHSIICDARAKALIKGIIQFNGKYGRDYCDVNGKHRNGRMLFLSQGNPRNDSSFRSKTKKNHHKTDSVFLILNIGMINCFPIDPMHALDLGVMKKLLLLWKEGPLHVRQSARSMTILSNHLILSRQHIPSIFNRLPRAVKEVRMWKATEFRMFLLYLGPIVLQNVLPEELYKHFMTLNVATRILYSSDLVSDPECLSEAHELLCNFVDEGRVLYGKEFVTYNVHILT
jgi:hypothetical protein